MTLLIKKYKNAPFLVSSKITLIECSLYLNYKHNLK